MKIVINKCFGGFSLSKEACEELGIASYYDVKDKEGFRADPKLIAVVEKLGSERVSGGCAELAIIEIPDGVKWQIEEYKGLEHIAEQHRTWS